MRRATTQAYRLSLHCIQFLSTLSLRRATTFICIQKHLHLFLSTLSLRRATHALPCPACRCTISIHALLAESDQSLKVLIFGRASFLSTLSLRRATCRLYKLITRDEISIHALLAESDLYINNLLMETAISIHALLAESDGTGGAEANTWWISIHALLAESDRHVKRRARAVANFYPRSPCGERPACRCTEICNGGFLSTLSLRRATVEWRNKPQVNADFYPRSPCGERRQGLFYFLPPSRFLSTLSLRRATKPSTFAVTETIISIHALLAESDGAIRELQ